MDLVEAAVRSGRRAEAEAHVEVIHRADLAALSPHYALLAAGAAALVAEGPRATALYEAAAALPAAAIRPMELARIQLAHGEHLRRLRATSASRVPLGAALRTFRRLGAASWAARAQAELRAAGGVAGAGDKPGIGPLTPQEHEIAVLAAGGMTNNQIAQRLGLSRRTVEAHLRNVFPKLGITSRAAFGGRLAVPNDRS